MDFRVLKAQITPTRPSMEEGPVPQHFLTVLLLLMPGGNTHVHLISGRHANIQRVNKFLDKIDLVADAILNHRKPKAQTDVLKGEALFLRVFMYHNLARTYGGLVLLETAAQLSMTSGMTNIHLEEP